MRKFLTLVFAIAIIATTFAQNETKKWAFGAGISAMDFSGPITKDYFDFDEYKGQGHFFIGRYLNPSFNAKVNFSFGKVWYPSFDVYPETNEGIYNLKHIYDAGLTFEYKFNNGYIFKEDAVIAPYIFAGIGMNSIVDYDINTYAPFGVGLNIRPADWLTFNLSSAYKLNIDNSFDYTHHSATMVFNLGKTQVAETIEETQVTDADNDGVPDLIDECPFAAGTQEFFGCPDTDGDNVGDSRDNCPQMAGPIDNKGCPSNDADNDGVPDDKDSCPNLKGDKRYAGCPDTDGDGIVDKYDKCPNEAGTASNNGCPKATTTPVTPVNTIVTTPTNTNTTTPVNTTVTPPPVITPIVGTASGKYVIYFGSALDDVPAGERKKVEEAIALLKANPTWKAKLNGYTDEMGDEYENVDLSLRRATGVWRYMSNKGITGDRIELYGNGEYFPQSNEAAKNRIVIIELVK